MHRVDRGGKQAHLPLDPAELHDCRWPLDPGCARGAGACLACLHVGEPSCRYFNTYLDRKALFGEAGYLRPDLAVGL